MSLNDGLSMGRSYYAATANAFASAPKLEGEVNVDVCVIGGGCTGLSAALHLAERGYKVALIEAGKIGWGASGRNGGQMIPGLRLGAAELVKRYGREDARRVFALALEARALTLDLAQKINCDLKTTGHLLCAAKSSDPRWMAEEVACLHEVMNYQYASVLSDEETRAELASPDFHGALLDRGGGHLHPLNFTLGLAEAARSAGVALYENSAAKTILAADDARVITADGDVRARYVVLACDALLGNLQPNIASRIMPVANYIATTAPLENPSALIANDRAISDSRFVVNYFRLTADNRLLFGGGERYTAQPPADIPAFVRGHMLKIFPQLSDAEITHAWGGMVSITMTRLPHLGRDGNTFFAHGYSGQGVLLSNLAGKLIAEALAGHAERFDLFAEIAPPPFPGGTLLRDPLYVLGMLWYALRDRL